MRWTTVNHYRPKVVLVVFAAAVLAAGLLALVGAKTAWAAEPTFASAQNTTVGTNPTTVTNADFNGDGNMDLAAQNSGSNNVSVLLGKGDGTYPTKTDYTVGTGPSAVTSADLNGDDKEDLAVSNWYSNNISVLLGNGNGTFQPATNVAAGTNPSSVTSADFNGDTIADLAVANYRDVNYYGSVSVLLGKGDGTFQPKTDFPVYQRTCNDFLCTSNTAGPNQVIVADFNRDTKADLATANSGGCDPIGFCASGGVSVLLGNGNGTFQTARLPKSNTTIYSIDGNDSGDIVAAEYDFNAVSVLTSNGDGTFTTGQRFTVGSNPSAVTSADLNGDSVADLAVSNFTSDNVSVLWGNGSSSFQAAQDYPVGDGPIFVIGAELNADTFADLAVANQNSNNVSVLLNNGAGDTTAPTVGSVSPADAATGVALTANAEATFSEAMDPNTISTTTFKLTKQGDPTALPAAVSYAAATKTATLNLNSDLVANTTYTATVTTGAKDLAGKALERDHSWTFTTAPPDTTPSCTKNGTSANDTISGTSGKDVICGLGGNDTIRGLGGDDILIGGDGNDRLIGGTGNDTLDGGLGTDTGSYSPSLTAVNASLATKSATGEGSDTFVAIENLIGSSKADTLTGDGAANRLTGGGGADTLRAGAGNDTVIGSGGADSLFGEDGNDTVNSKDSVNGNDSLDGGAGTDTRVTDTTERSIIGFP